MLPPRFLALAVGLRPEAPPLQFQATRGGLLLATSLGLPAQELLGALLDGDRGALFYERFKPEVLALAIFNADASCRRLCAALGERM